MYFYNIKNEAIQSYSFYGSKITFLIYKHHCIVVVSIFIVLTIRCFKWRTKYDLSVVNIRLVFTSVGIVHYIYVYKDFILTKDL